MLEKVALYSWKKVHPIYQVKLNLTRTDPIPSDFTEGLALED